MAVENKQDAQPYLYDDFFSTPGDSGVDTTVLWRGRALTFRLRKSLTLGEKQEAMSDALSISITKEGVPSIDKMDQAAYTRRVVLAAVKAWPFEYAPGQAVPITAETVAALDGSLAEKLASIVLGQDQQQDQAISPFGLRLGAA